MHPPDGIRGRRLLASLAAALALVATGSVSGSLAQDPSPSPVQAATVVHGWVGARAAPAGLYSWREGGQSWMHKIPDSGSGSVEITFGTLEDAYGIPMDEIGRAGVVTPSSPPS